MPDQAADAATSVTHLRVPVALATRDTQAALLDLARQGAPDPAIFEEHPPVFFQTESSSSRVDSYFTSMQDSSLRNYAADAVAGIAFQDSHKYDGMIRTLGMSVNGVYEAGQGALPSRTLMDFYTLPTLNATNREFVDRVRAGLARDVSIGFNGGKTICSICNNEMFNWARWGEDDACYHIPGVEYAVVDDSGTKMGGTRVAIGLVEDAHVGEVSTVFDGSTPGAGFIGIKARQMATEGILPAEQRTLIEARYGIVLPKGGRAIPVAGAPHAATTKGDAPMPEAKKPDTTTDQPITREIHETAIRAAREDGQNEQRVALARMLREQGHEIADDGDVTRAILTIVQDNTRLRPLADDGTTYRGDLIDLVVEEGVRAFGNEYEEEQEREELRGLPLASIKRRLATYKRAADPQFRAGRGTTDETVAVEDAAPTPIKGRRHDSVFRA